jgi:hypothetical protein
MPGALSNNWYSFCLDNMCSNWKEANMHPLIHISFSKTSSCLCPHVLLHPNGAWVHFFVYDYILKCNHFPQRKYVTLLTFFPLIYSNQNSFHRVFIYFVPFDLGTWMYVWTPKSLSFLRSSFFLKRFPKVFCGQVPLMSYGLEISLGGTIRNHLAKIIRNLDPIKKIKFHLLIH